MGRVEYVPTQAYPQREVEVSGQSYFLTALS